VKRRLTFLVAALQSLFVIALALGLTMVPLTISWLIDSDGSTPWSVSFQASADVWFAAHGVPLVFAAGKFMGVAVPSFAMNFLPLGFSAFIAYAAFRLGRQLGFAEVLWPGWLGATSSYAVVTWMLASVTPNSSVMPDSWLAAVLPPAFFFVFLVFGSLTSPLSAVSFEAGVLPTERKLVGAWFQTSYQRLRPAFGAILLPALRAGTGVVVMLLGVSALAISILLTVNWIQVTQLYESLQVSFFGAVLLTLGQLAILPNLVIFGTSWLTGVGFSIGTGSQVSPLGTDLGPIPVVPVFGALPVGHFDFGMIVLIVPLLSAFVATILVRGHLAQVRYLFALAWSAAFSVGLSIAAVAAIEMTLLALMASGSAGPGRLQEVGANPFALGLVTFAEVGAVSVLTAFYSAKPDAPDQELINRVRRPRAVN
jgi:hypothetical protein